MKDKIAFAIVTGLALVSMSASAQEAATWPENIKIKGDIRARYESVEVDGETSKSRMRGRARFGMYADVNDQVRAGIRIATGSDESPTSTNQSVQDFGNKRAIWMDLAYIGYTPDSVENLDIVIGKMKKPWVAVSDLLFDGDLNPEGLNLNYVTGGDVKVTTNLGYYLWQDAVNDDPTTDVNMIAAQLALEIPMSDSISFSFGGNLFFYDNIEDAEIPDDLNKGNSSDEDGTWTYGYELVEGFAQLDIKTEALPITIYADYIVNTASDVEDDTAYLFGFKTKYQKLSFDYNYRDLDADSVVGLLADSDFAGGGTGGTGHKFKAKYSLAKNTSAGLTYFLTEDGDGEDVNTLQADLEVKF